VNARRPLVFGALVLPLVVWLALRLWVNSNIDHWIASAVELPLSNRVALASDNWLVRYVPFAIISVVVLGPALAIGVAAIAGCFGGSLEPPSGPLLFWWTVSVGFLSCIPLLASLTPAFELSLNVVLPIALAWAGFLAYSISLGSAFAVQRARVAAGRSQVNPRWVLALAARNCPTHC
jgi:hypothetical protein